MNHRLEILEIVESKGGFVNTNSLRREILRMKSLPVTEVGNDSKVVDSVISRTDVNAKISALQEGLK